MKKSIKIILFIVLTILLASTNVFAATDKCKIQLTPNKTNLNIGDIVEIEVKLSNIKVESGITTISGALEYDTDIFEIIYENTSEVDLSSIKEETGLDSLKVVCYQEGGWCIVCGELGEGAVFLAETYGDEATSSETIGKIKFKIKNSAITTTTDVILSEVTVVDGDGSDIELESESKTTLQINAIKSNGTNNGGTQQTDKDTANTGAPYAGIEEVAPGIIIVIGVVAIIAAIKLIKYKDIK